MREPRHLAEVTSAEGLQEINRTLRELTRNVNLPGLPNFTLATRPIATDMRPGTIIFVSDGGAGAVFQGSTGTAWVNLG